jgi:hypothetical protein
MAWSTGRAASLWGLRPWKGGSLVTVVANQVGRGGTNGEGLVAPSAGAGRRFIAKGDGW